MKNTTVGVEIKIVPEQLVVSRRWQGAYSDTGKIMEKIYRVVGRVSAGPALNLCYDGEYKDVATLESCLPVKEQVKSELNCRLLPQQRCVSLVHQGSYETLGESYKAMFDYIKENNLTMMLPTREVYIKGPGVASEDNPEKYLTELLIPVE